MTTPAIPTLCLAEFLRLGPGTSRVSVLTVPFNPESLQYTVSNKLRAEGTGTTAHQIVNKTDPKLTMQLVFDTTDTGVDVRASTGKLARLVNPYDDSKKSSGGAAKASLSPCSVKPAPKKTEKVAVPPNVEFSWGNFVFIGLIDSFKETLDYFSANGVPLRAVVDISMLGHQPTLGPRSASTGGALGKDDLAKTPESPVVDAPGGPAAAASRLGVPDAARDIARANGAPSLRGDGGNASGSGPLALPQTPSLAKETAFSTGAPSRGGAGLSLGAGVGAGAGAGRGIGIGATSGSAFEGLRSKVEVPSPLPDGGALFSASASFGVSTGGGFGVGGAASSGGAGPCTEVGSAADLIRLIRFE